MKKRLEVTMCIQNIGKLIYTKSRIEKLEQVKNLYSVPGHVRFRQKVFQLPDCRVVAWHGLQASDPN